MRCFIDDKQYGFVTAFDTQTGAYVRTGIIDDTGRDTGIDPFMTSFPHLIDVGIMGHCIHGKTSLCYKAGIGCYQNGLHIEESNMTLMKVIDNDFVLDTNDDGTFQIVAYEGLLQVTLIFLSVVRGIEITCIGESAFRGAKTLDDYWMTTMCYTLSDLEEPV
ncbi:MAG: hypothetical protein ACOX58_05755 [Christensenellales bacterium]